MTDKATATRHRILRTARSLVFEQGYAGTSLDEIVSATELTKGAFFYHFRNKADLAKALIKQYADDDTAFFVQLSKAADEHTDDPLENVLAFLEFFEDYLTHRTRRVRSCLYSSFAHEHGQFDDEIMAIVRDGMARWRAVYRRKFERLLQHREPRIAVTAEDLTDMITCLIEGALIRARVDDDNQVIVRQSQQFRQYLELLFR